MHEWEASEKHGNCELRSRGSSNYGDVLGRGKSFQRGETTLWHSGKQIVGNIHSLEASRDDRWAFISTLDSQGKLTTELHIVNIQDGVIHRKVELPGWVFDTEWDPAGLRFAVAFKAKEKRLSLQLDVFDTTRRDILPRTVFRGSGDYLHFPMYAWSPDSSSLAFEVTTRGSPDVHEFIHLSLAGVTAELVTRVGSSGGGQVDWTDPLRPVLK